MSVYVVGIGGVSNGGKTTLTKETATFLNSRRIKNYIFHQDDYYKDEKELAYDTENKFYLWDVPEAFHMKSLVHDVKNKIKSAAKLNEDFVIIIEGILTFNHKELNELFTKRFFLTLSKHEAYRRRQNRIYEPPDTDTLFQDHVWPMYRKYFDDLQEHDTSMTLIDGEWTVAHCTDIVVDFLVDLLNLIS